jgi:hypothetical protein
MFFENVLYSIPLSGCGDCLFFVAMAGFYIAQNGVESEMFPISQ